jgi:hypothetical protein
MYPLQYILRTLRTVTFNMSDMYGIVKDIPPSYQKDIILETLKRDLEYLIKLENFIKKEFEAKSRNISTFKKR